MMMIIAGHFLYLSSQARSFDKGQWKCPKDMVEMRRKYSRADAFLGWTVSRASREKRMEERMRPPRDSEYKKR